MKYPHHITLTINVRLEVDNPLDAYTEKNDMKEIILQTLKHYDAKILYENVVCESELL